MYNYRKPTTTMHLLSRPEPIEPGQARPVTPEQARANHDALRRVLARSAKDQALATRQCVDALNVIAGPLRDQCMNPETSDERPFWRPRLDMPRLRF